MKYRPRNILKLKSSKTSIQQSASIQTKHSGLYQKKKKKINHTFQVMKAYRIYLKERGGTSLFLWKTKKWRDKNKRAAGSTTTEEMIKSGTNV